MASLIRTYVDAMLAMRPAAERGRIEKLCGHLYEALRQFPEPVAGADAETACWVLEEVLLNRRESADVRKSPDAQAEGVQPAAAPSVSFRTWTFPLTCVACHAVNVLPFDQLEQPGIRCPSCQASVPLWDIVAAFRPGIDRAALVTPGGDRI